MSKINVEGMAKVLEGSELDSKGLSIEELIRLSDLIIEFNTLRDLYLRAVRLSLSNPAPKDPE